MSAENAMTIYEAKAMFKATVKSITDAGFVVTRGGDVMTSDEHQAKITTMEAEIRNDPATIRANVFAAEQRAFFVRAKHDPV